jgi:hypothetical protein
MEQHENYLHNLKFLEEPKQEHYFLPFMNMEKHTMKE